MLGVLGMLDVLSFLVSALAYLTIWVSLLGSLGVLSVSVRGVFDVLE